jgi:dTDP-L-rhamnose 4-epimerase
LRRARFEPVCPICAGEVTAAQSRESDPVSPSSIYGITKLAQEQVVLNACAVADVPAVALRYQNVYGPGQSLRNPYTGILSIFTELIRQGATIELFEDGAATRDFVFISDVTEYNVRAVTQDLSGVHVLNVGSSERFRLDTVVSILGGSLGLEAPARVSGHFRAGDIRHAAADTARLRSVLGGHEFTRFPAGVQQLLTWVLQREPEPGAEARYRKSLLEMRALGLLGGGARDNREKPATSRETST